MLYRLRALCALRPNLEPVTARAFARPAPDRKFGNPGYVIRLGCGGVGSSTRERTGFEP